MPRKPKQTKTTVPAAVEAVEQEARSLAPMTPDEIKAKTREVVQLLAEQTGMGTAADLSFDTASYDAAVEQKPEPVRKRQPGEDTPEEVNGKPEPRVRGWTHVIKGGIDYERITGRDQYGTMRHAFRFKLPPGQEMPPAEALDVLRQAKQSELGAAAGLSFRNDRALGKAWLMDFNPTGGELADKLDFALQQVATKAEGRGR